LDLIQEFATIRAAEDNIKVKLKGFKPVYDLDDISDDSNHVFFESFEQAQIRKQAKIDYDQCIAILEDKRKNEE